MQAISSARAALVLIALLATFSAACRWTSGPPTPHGIVLIVLDTLRADRLSGYGNPRATSPRLDRLAAEGALFENAISHAAWTLPAFVGLLSGSYPNARVFHDGRLAHSLVEDLGRAGYTTAAFTEGAYVSRPYGIDLGFAQFTANNDKPFMGAGATTSAAEHFSAQTFAAASSWLREHADERFFLLVHTFEVHAPYLRREFAAELPRGRLPEAYSYKEIHAVRTGQITPSADEIDYVRALYDGGVATADREVGGLLDILDELGIADDTLVIVTSDHGEELGERTPKDLGVHGSTLYDTLLHVPLIVRFPSREFVPQRIAAQVRLVDTLPTILDLAGIPVPPDLDGRSLVPLLEGTDRADRPAYAELLHDKSVKPLVRKVALRDGRFKLIVNAPPLAPGDAVAELYDVAADPAEQHNRASEEGEAKDRLADALRRQRDALQQTGHATLEAKNVPPDVQERLRALGYVD